MHHTIIPTRRLGAVIAAALLAAATLLAPSAPARADAPAPDRQTARYEVDFMTGMIDHHQMAIMMSRMCLDKAVHDDLEEMCEDIIAAQQQEIATMQEWLSDWYDVDYEPQLTEGDMRSMHRFERLEGEDFEVAFMRSMIRHHKKAVTEARGCVDRADHDELVEMCEDIIDVQLAEIEQLQTWLCEWYDRCTGRRGDTA